MDAPRITITAPAGDRQEIDPSPDSGLGRLNSDAPGQIDPAVVRLGDREQSANNFFPNTRKQQVLTRQRRVCEQTTSYRDRYFAGIGLSAVSASQKIVTIHQRVPSL
jgi:hypothetical protein